MRKTVGMVGAMLALIAAVPFSVWILRNRQEIRSRAAPATTLAIIPSDITIDPGETVSLTVHIDTGGNSVTAAKIAIEYDPSYVEMLSISNGPQFPTVLSAGAISDGVAEIYVGAASTAQPVTGTGTAASFTVAALDDARGQTTIRFSPQTFVSGLGESSPNVLVQTASALVTVGSVSKGGLATDSTPTPTVPSDTGSTPSPSAAPSPEPTIPVTITSIPTVPIVPTPTGHPTIPLSITHPAQNELVTDPLPDISGRANPGDTVTVTITPLTEQYSTIVDANGEWSTKITRPLTPGQYQITATSSASGNSATVIFVFGSVAADQSAQTIPVTGHASMLFGIVGIAASFIFLGYYNYRKSYGN